MTAARPDRFPHLGRAVAGFLLAWLGGAMAGFVVLAALVAGGPFGPDAGAPPTRLPVMMLPLPVVASLAGFGLVRWLGFRRLPGAFWWGAAVVLLLLTGVVAVWLQGRATAPFDQILPLAVTLGPGLIWAIRADAGQQPGDLR